MGKCRFKFPKRIYERPVNWYWNTQRPAPWSGPLLMCNLYNCSIYNFTSGNRNFQGADTAGLKRWSTNLDWIGILRILASTQVLSRIRLRYLWDTYAGNVAVAPLATVKWCSIRMTYTDSKLYIALSFPLTLFLVLHLIVSRARANKLLKYCYIMKSSELLSTKPNH